MDAAVLSSLIQAGSAGVQTGGSSISSIINRKWNAQQAQKQRDWTLEMWNRENEYNTPSAQVQRLIDAGLNPNLAYGQIDMSSISAGAGAEASSSAMADWSSVGDLGLRIAQIQNLDAQTRKTEKSTELTQQQIATEMERAGLVHEEARKVAAEIPQVTAEVDRINESVNLIRQQIMTERVNRLMMRQQYRFEKETFDSRVGSIKAQFRCDDAEANLINRTLLASIGLANANAHAAHGAAYRSYTGANTDIALACYYLSNVGYVHSQTDMLNLQKDIYSKYGESLQTAQIKQILSSCNQLRQQTFSGYINSFLEPARLMHGYQSNAINAVRTLGF